MGALLMGTVAFFAWAYNQPTDFDLFVEAQKEFIDDLYDGKLLTDFSQQSKDDIDLVKSRRGPSSPLKKLNLDRRKKRPKKSRRCTSRIWKEKKTQTTTRTRKPRRRTR